MSDQTFGKAARAYWDELERADYRRRDLIAELIIATEHSGPGMWSAHDDATDFGPIGFGSTEKAAIDDLLSQLTD